MSQYHPIPYKPKRIPTEQGIKTLIADLEIAQHRRSVRQFSTDPVPREMIEAAIQIAGTAPSGAHRQPWHFVAISNKEYKEELRMATESEEKQFYEQRAPAEWLEALAPLGTDFIKEHITNAPWVIIVFRRDYDILEDGTKLKNYYMTESVGIAVGFLLQALHRAGLATLTHTPAPMTFLRDICGRPINEKPFVLIPVGYPSSNCQVPNLKRKTLEEISEFIT
ncbi:nitroreductase family protein [Kamptonema cortianum]|nr:nitroreductase family protein [Geitlerinema splendidum]MDK3156370.1 nitroreductase family protein [Kamptonema cortianum]